MNRLLFKIFEKYRSFFLLVAFLLKAAKYQNSNLKTLSDKKNPKNYPIYLKRLKSGMLRLSQ